MEALNQFLHMGGYAGYVWSSYGIALVLFVWSIASPLVEKGKINKRIRRVIENEKNT